MEASAVVYFVVWGLCAVGTLVFLTVVEAPTKRRWFFRISLLNLVCIGGLLLVMAGASSDFGVLAVLGTGLAAISYLHFARTRLCESCNSLLQPQGIFQAAEFCPRCGAPSVPFDPPFRRSPPDRENG